MGTRYSFPDLAQRIISLGPAITYICEPFGDFAPLFISPNIYQQLGYTPDEFLAEKNFWASHIHPDDINKTLDDLGELFENDHHEHEYRFLHQNGDYLWMYDELTLIRGDDGEPIEIIGFWQDITERKKIEQELIRAKEKAEEASEAKLQFLSRISHELRTPLNAILGFAQLLEIDDEEPLSDAQKQNIAQILQGGWHLLDVVKDLLDLSAIQTNNIELAVQPVNICGRVQDCVDLIYPLAQQRNITIQGMLNECIGKHVLADPVRLKQVLHNIMSNAVKYNRHGGSITLSCEEIKTGTIRVSVTDTGSGIPKTDMPTLFEPFNQLYLDASAVEGTGIGLTIAKQLVDLMGGNIGVISERGGGSTFWIDLPKSQTNSPANSITTQLDKLFTKNKKTKALIIYIEDSPSHVRLMEDIISGMAGLNLLSASTPKLGIELIKTHKPDVIILDICLPGMNGFELLGKLHTDPSLCNIPVIALSASALPRDIEKGLRAGFRRYLTKPLNIAEFIGAIKELVND